MLITFSCDAHENTTLFGSVAQKLLNLMGDSGIVPGALLAADVPAALARLQHAIAQVTPQASTKSSDDDDHEPEVSLVHRAIPLIALLQDAVMHPCDVMWEQG